MNVAQIVCAGSFAGAEAVACSLAEALRPHLKRSLLYLVMETRAGHASCAELLDRVRRFDVDLRVFETDRRWSWALARQLRDAFRADKVDIVHSHSYKSSVLVPLIRWRHDTPVRGLFFSLHGVDLPPSWGRVFLSGLTAIGAYACDVLIGCSEPIARHYRRFPLLGRKTYAVANALPPSFAPDLAEVRALRAHRRAELAKAYGLDPQAIWIATVGRLVPVKNIQLLLRGIADVRHGHMRAAINLLIVGEGPQRELLEREAAALDLADAVAFTGRVDDIERVYGSIDLLALTSKNEGTPMAILEGMAFGLPVVSSRVGGIPDLVVEDETALLFDSGNASECGAKLARLTVNAALRTQLGQAGYQRATTVFSTERWALRVLELYREWDNR